MNAPVPSTMAPSKKGIRFSLLVQACKALESPDDFWSILLQLEPQEWEGVFYPPKDKAKPSEEKVEEAAFWELVQKHQQPLKEEKCSLWKYLLRQQASPLLWEVLEWMHPQPLPKDSQGVLLDLLNSDLVEKKPLLEYAKALGFRWDCSARSLLTSLLHQPESFADEIVFFAAKFPQKMNEEKFSKANVQKNIALAILGSNKPRLIKNYLEAKEIANSVQGEGRFDAQEWFELLGSIHERLNAPQMALLEETLVPLMVRTFNAMLTGSKKEDATSALTLLDWVVEGSSVSPMKYKLAQTVLQQSLQRAQEGLLEQWLCEKTRSWLDFSQNFKITAESILKIEKALETFGRQKIDWELKDAQGLSLGEKVLYLWNPGLLERMIPLGFDVFLQKEHDTLLRKIERIEVLEEQQEEKALCMQIVRDSAPKLGSKGFNQ